MIKALKINNRMNLLMLYDFYIVACEGDIMISSKKHNLPPESLGRSIRNLEIILEHPLFYRHTHGMELTDFGRKLYQEIKPLFGLYSEII